VRWDWVLVIKKLTAWLGFFLFSVLVVFAGIGLMAAMD
jgi:hypothetical protein